MSTIPASRIGPTQSLPLYRTGRTSKCGCGSVAPGRLWPAAPAAVAAILGGYVDQRVTVHLLGGDLQISWSGKAEDSVMMTGPATTVFSGKIDL